MNGLYVMIGGFFGAISRYGVGIAFYTEQGFPWGTFVVNIIGCFLLSWLLTTASRSRKIPSQLTLLLGTGFLGSFTTFSTFSMETIHLFQAGHLLLPLLYVLLTTTLGLLLTYAGHHWACSYHQGGDAV
nr:fluoride efflux transporter CrcB [Rubeoparvulum massiliense]